MQATANATMDILKDDNLMREILLDNICQQLQLDSTRENVMRSAYKAITKIIEEDSDFFKPLEPCMYVYGSKAIGTTTKPYKQDEFDLDFVVKVKYDWNEITQSRFLDKLYTLLNNHGTYNGKVERKRFCVRIDYKSEFHMDIMPCCEITSKQEKLKAPDTKRKIWVNRNPKGFIEWFEEKFILEYSAIQLNEYYKYVYSFELRGEVENMPESQEYRVVQPLQRAVQLIKRRRDIYFENNPDIATSSIILTTIAGMFYNGESSIFDAIDGVITRVGQLIEERGINNPIEIINPADFYEKESDREKFSDKWLEGRKGHELYEAFVGFISDFKHKWNEFKNFPGKPVEIVSSLFGRNITEKSFEHQIKLVNTERENGNLKVDRTSGALTTSRLGALTIPKTTIHGAHS